MKEKFAISFLSPIISRIYAFIASYFLLLLLDVEIIGLWSFLNSIILLSFMFIDIGLSNIHRRYSSKKNFDAFYGSFFFIKLCLIVLNLIITMIMITIFNFWNSPFLIYLLILLISEIINSLILTFNIHLRCKFKIFKVELPFLFKNLIFNSLKIYFVFNLRTTLDPILFLSIISLASNIFFFLIIIFLSKKDIRIGKPKKDYIKEYFKDSKPLILFSIFSIISVNLGKIIVGYYFSLKELAYLDLAYTYIIPFFGIFSSLLISLGIPLFSKNFAKKNKVAIQKILHILEKYCSIILLSIIIIFIVGGDLIFIIFLPKYLAALPILYIFLFYAYFTEINRGYLILLISGKKEKLSALISTLNILTIFTLMIILIPQSLFGIKMLGLGAVGYSLSYLIPVLILTLIIRILITRLFEIKYQKQIIIQICSAFFTCFIVYLFRIFVFSSILDFNRLYLLISLSLLSLGLFIIFLILFKVLRKGDIIILFELFNINNYLKSLRQEFKYE